MATKYRRVVYDLWDIYLVPTKHFSKNRLDETILNWIERSVKSANNVTRNTIRSMSKS